jgi:long-chain fatty acid transport protein
MASQVPAVAVYADGAEVRSDIPALLTLGAQYSILDNVRVMGGFHYFFDKDAKGSATDVEKNTWEVTLGAEWDVNNWLTVSAGTQRTKYGFGQNMQDTNFNVSSTALCLGATFHVSKMVNINAGYMHSFYNDHTIERTADITDTYTRKNDAVGVSVDLKF